MSITMELDKNQHSANCNSHLDRDVNAAKNILARGLETLF